MTNYDDNDTHDALTRSIADIPDVEPPADLTDRIMERVSAEKKQANSPGLMLPFRKYGPIAAVVTLFVLALPFVMMYDPEPVSTHHTTTGGSVAVNNTGTTTQTTQGGTTQTVIASVDTNPEHYVDEKQVDAYFSEWDEELEQNEADSLMAYGPMSNSYGGFEPFSEDDDDTFYDDPLSDLVGF